MPTQVHGKDGFLNSSPIILILSGRLTTLDVLRAKVKANCQVTEEVSNETLVDHPRKIWKKADV